MLTGRVRRGQENTLRRAGVPRGDKRDHRSPHVVHLDQDFVPPALQNASLRRRPLVGRSGQLANSIAG
jgi:hypothetical protein